MGTETKFNCYSENTSTDGSNNISTKSFIKGSTSSSNIISKNINCNDVVVINGNNSINDNTNKDILNGALIEGADVTEIPLATNQVPYVPVFVDENNVVEGAKEILKVIRPQWDLNVVHFKKFTDGITNKLVGCFNTQAAQQTTTTTDSIPKSNGSPPSTSNGHIKTNGTSSPSIVDSNDNDNDDNDNDNESDDHSNSESDIDSETAQSTTKCANNVVLVRVYGNKTDLLIDRKAETRNILLLHSYGLAPSLYATFKNGLAYDYVPGVTLNAKNVLQPEVWCLVARRMAELHRGVKPSLQPGETTDSIVPMLWKKTQSFFDLVPERFSSADKHKRLEGTFLPITRLRDEFNELYQHLVTLDSPLVFAHNDLLLGNVVYTESQQTVTFIDYEYADYNFQAFDIGNHFAEFAGVDEVDYSRYPKREFQLEWLRVYLQAYLQRSDISDDEVDRLYVQVNNFALAAHFFWTIWSLIQAEHSTNDFDYADYALTRYKEYLYRKNEFLALKFKQKY